MKRLRLGTRASDLAIWQTSYVLNRLSEVDGGLSIEVVELSSTGDEMAGVPINELEGTGFFTSTLERALVRGEIDVAVHSCKDLPVDPTAGLTVAAIPERGPVEDVLCARARACLASLPSGARVGTCSLRRTAQLRALRDDLEHVALRGNVPTRIQRVVSGELDAIVMARAGLERLGLMHHVTEIFPVEQVLPAPAQGALAVQIRTGEAQLQAQLSAIDDATTHGMVEAERTLLHALGGGCSVPVGALARVEDGTLSLEAAVFELESGRSIRVRLEGRDPQEVGEEGARRLIDQGADAILAAVARTREPAVEPGS